MMIYGHGVDAKLNKIFMNMREISWKSLYFVVNVMRFAKLIRFKEMYEESSKR